MENMLYFFPPGSYVKITINDKENKQSIPCLLLPNCSKEVEKSPFLNRSSPNVLGADLLWAEGCDNQPVVNPGQCGQLLQLLP